MKKIMFLLLMCIGLLSSLYALDTGRPISCDVEKSQILSETDGLKITPNDVAYVKVNILHKDTLTHSLGECGIKDNRMSKKWIFKANIMCKNGGYGSVTGDIIEI